MTSTARAWLDGARPRTLPASVTPVLVGTAVAYAEDGIVWWRALLAMLVAVALQVGCNYANDYSDGIRGTDEHRVGPARLVGSGLARPRTVLVTAVCCFAVAAVVGLVLAVVTTLWLLAVGAPALAAAWFYTGGSRPYGYRALGEISVLVFFGVVPVVGTAFVQTEQLSWLALWCSLPVAFLVVDLLVVNNLRDIPTDAAAGKRTLAVLLGDRGTRRLYVVLLAAALAGTVAVIVLRPWSALALLAIPLAWLPLRLVVGGATGAPLVLALRDTGRLELAYGVLLTAGLTLSAV
ncbi:MAG: 1,4-dihydroxy-2-naphthoate polyprenyltransferase [Streptosporangiales bacterium]|nr:1,4-dihydroxy-2-naphthoate polyprenyltransferase [Streptosporangiales bacterium]